MTAAEANTGPGTFSDQGILARHPLFFFFLIAYAGAWIIEAPVVLSQTGTGLLPFTVPRPLQVLAIAAATFTGPTLSAFVMTSIAEGKAGTNRLLRRYVLWRVRLRWYLFVLLAIPASEVLGAIILPGVVASYQSLTLPMTLAYPARLCFYVHPWRPTRRRARLARFCTASPATAARSTGRKPHPGRAVGIVAPAPVLEWGLDAAHHCQYRHVCPDDHRIDRHHDVGLQQREGQPAHHHVDACVLQHVRQQDSGATLPRAHPERVRTLACADRLRGGGVGRYCVDPGQPGLPTLPARRKIRLSRCVDVNPPLGRIQPMNGSAESPMEFDARGGAVDQVGDEDAFIRSVHAVVGQSESEQQNLRAAPVRQLGDERNRAAGGQLQGWPSEDAAAGGRGRLSRGRNRSKGLGGQQARHRRPCRCRHRNTAAR